MSDIYEQLNIVMPVYNEEEIVSHVIESWISELHKLNINFVFHAYNDGSKDGTRKILDTLAGKYPELHVCHKLNEGHGPTILHAYRVLADKEDEWIFQIDSDDELSPADFHKVWEQRTKANFVVGRRRNRKQRLSRRIVSFISRAVVRVLYGQGIWDINSPYRLMRTRAFAKFIKKIPADTFAPNVILSGCAAWAKIPSIEVSISHCNRTTGCESLNHWKLFISSCRSFLQTVAFRFSLSNTMEQ